MALCTNPTIHQKLDWKYYQTSSKCRNKQVQATEKRIDRRAGTDWHKYPHGTSIGVNGGDQFETAFSPSPPKPINFGPVSLIDLTLHLELCDQSNHRARIGKWSQPNHSLTIALEAPATWESLPYTKINKTCKFRIDWPSGRQNLEKHCKSSHTSNKDPSARGNHKQAPALQGPKKQRQKSPHSSNKDPSARGNNKQAPLQVADQSSWSFKKIATATVTPPRAKKQHRKSPHSSNKDPPARGNNKQTPLQGKLILIKYKMPPKLQIDPPVGAVAVGAVARGAALPPCKLTNNAAVNLIHSCNTFTTAAAMVAAGFTEEESKNRSLLNKRIQDSFLEELEHNTVTGTWGFTERTERWNTVNCNASAGMDGTEFTKVVKDAYMPLYPDLAPVPGKRVVLLVDSGPGREDNKLQIITALEGLYLLTGVPNTTHIWQPTDQNYGPFKTMFRKNKKILNKSWRARELTVRSDDIPQLVFRGPETEYVTLDTAFHKVFSVEKSKAIWRHIDYGLKGKAFAAKAPPNNKKDKITSTKPVKAKDDPPVGAVEWSEERDGAEVQRLEKAEIKMKETELGQAMAEKLEKCLMEINHKRVSRQRHYIKNDEVALPEVERKYDEDSREVEQISTLREEEAVTRNKMAKATLTMAFQDYEDYVAWIEQSRIDKWPSGQLYQVIKEMKDEFAPDNVARKVDQKNDPWKISMKKKENPKTLCTQITAIDIKYRGKVMALLEEDKYQETILRVRPDARRDHGGDPTMKELWLNIFELWKSKGRKNPKKKGKGKDIRCYRCGKKGHMKRDYRTQRERLAGRRILKANQNGCRRKTKRRDESIAASIIKEEYCFLAAGDVVVSPRNKTQNKGYDKDGRRKNRIKFTDCRYGTCKFNLCAKTKMISQGWEMTGNVTSIKLQKGDQELHFDIPMQTKGNVTLWAMYLESEEADAQSPETVLVIPSKMLAAKAHAFCGHNNISRTKQIANHLGWETQTPFQKCEACTKGKARQKNLGEGEKNPLLMAIEHISGAGMLGWYNKKIGYIEEFCSKFNSMKQTGKELKGSNFQKAINGVSWQFGVQFEFMAKTPQRNPRPYKSSSESYWVDTLNVEEIKGAKKTKYEWMVNKNLDWIKNMQVTGMAGVVKTHQMGTSKITPQGKTCLFANYSEDHTGDCCAMFDQKARTFLKSRNVLWLDRMYYKEKKGRAVSITIEGM
eukprot:jgi/Psemu1/6163/gm1.6163_g